MNMRPWEWCFADGLDAVDVDDGDRVFLGHLMSDRVDGVDRSGLVLNVHDGDEDCVVFEGGEDIFGVNTAVTLGRDLGDAKT